MTPQSIIDGSRAAAGLWASESAKHRRKVLARFALCVAEHQDELVAAVVSDTGKPALDALGGDVLVTLEQMRFYHRHAHRILAPRSVPHDWLLFRKTRFTQTYEPHGVALIYGPSNYPLQLSIVPAITALYAGNAVVLKLSEQTPALAALLTTLIEQAQLPKDVLQIVSDPPQTASAYIDALPDFVCFTGSSANGMEVATRAAKHLIPVLLELGGKDAAIVFRDCFLDRTLEGIVYGAFVNSGQVCVGIKRLFVEDAFYDEFLRRLVQRVAQLRIGKEQNGTQDLTPLENERLRSHLAAQIADAIERGAKVLTDSGDLTGATPVILTNVPSDARLLNEESFGPVLCIARFSSEAEAVRLANDSGFALGASMWTRDRNKAQRMATALNAANLCVNDVIRNIANPSAPFGGNQSSGYGRYHGAAGLYTFSRSKSIMVSRSKATREFNWFPFTAKTQRQLRTLIRLRHRTLARFTRFFLLLVVLLGARHANAQGRLHVQVNVPAGHHGPIAYLVFTSAAGFPKTTGKAIDRGFLPESLWSQGIDIGPLPRGRYAVALYLDENNNHKLDSGWLGIPKEPVGVSRNPAPRMDSPRFDDSVFQMGDKDLTLEIRLVKP